MVNLMKRSPEPLDRVYDFSRLDQGKRPDGLVLLVDDDNEMYTVVFPERVIEYRTDQCVRINGILHHRNTLVFNPELLYEGQEETRYWYGDLEWSSSDGGKGEWQAS